MAMLNFHYHMRITFSEPVKEHCFTLRCLPREHPGQALRGLKITIVPEGGLSRGTDSFGNPYVYGRRPDPHTEFSVTVEGTAETGPAPVPLPEDYKLGPFRMFTALTAPGPALQALYRALPAPFESAGERIRRRAEQVHGFLRYAPGATGPETTAEEAAALGKGVCQDYSHILLALLRMDGIACRYVCGMMAGEGESHAWVEAACEGTWLGLDPTNLCPAGESYLAFSAGRDAADCTINRGIYRGNAAQSSEISVRVCTKGETA